MTLADLLAATILLALALYALLGGADFGGGVWDLLARGPRAAAQRQLIERAMAPVWEANHVWLILVVVLLFTGFPPAFAAIGTALHVPATLMLLGIVARGSAFVFRQYGSPTDQVARRWGLVFSVASVLTPIALGVLLGAASSGTLAFDGFVPVHGYVWSWLRVFPLAVGVFTLALFAQVAAVYLTCEAEDAALSDDFRARALGAGAAAVLLGLVTQGLAPPDGHFARAFGQSWWRWPLLLAAGSTTLLCFVGLWRRRYRGARVAVIAQVLVVVLGFGLAQAPYVVAPNFTIANSAAPDVTLRITLLTLGVGAVVLFPSLYYLMRVFKR